MRVGIATLFSRPGVSGGVNIATQRLVEALADFGERHSFAVLIDESAADAWSYRQWPGHIEFKTIAQSAQMSIATRGWRSARRRLGLSNVALQGLQYQAEQIDALGLDVIHYPETIIAHLSLKTPCVLTCFDIQQEYYPQFFTGRELAWRAANYRASVEKAVRVIAPSAHTGRTLMEKFGTPAEKISYIAIGIGPDFRRVGKEEIARVREKFGLPECFVYYPANPWQHKNHSRLMAALRVYRARYAESPWLVLSGRLPDECRDSLSLAIAAGVDDRLVDIGFVSGADLPAIYSAAALMVFPSLFEGFGMPILEALACGCPIAASEATSIPEVANGAALLFDPMNPEEVATSIRRGLTDPALHTELAERGYRQVEAFGWRSIVSRLLETYEGVGLR